MKFADELRRAPANGEEKKQQQNDSDWKAFIQMWYHHIKGECRDSAESGFNYADVCLDDFVKRISDEIGEFYHADGKLRPVKYEEHSMFDRLQPRIAFYLRNADEYTDGLHIDDMFDVKEQITDLLETDGLTVKGEYSSYDPPSGRRYHLSFHISW